MTTTAPGYTVTENRVDAFGVSRFAARVERSAPKSDLQRYADLATDWHKAMPLTFKKAYCVAGPPDDPFVDPPRITMPTSGDYMLFEDFVWPWPGAAVFGAEYRNILALQVERNDHHFSLEYRLYMALTATVDEVTGQGGPDVDSGEFVVDFEESASGDGKLKMTASKHIRFSCAAPFNEELNFLALPFLNFFIRAVLLA